ncbi:putative ribonuclease H-like domain-containing protein [Tanacetum coccineum]|uniref:Ribonuclease H-like domain-containing protein n=1 Tax=Tanacetum coccineum TaxID=301880 RepID=A0ABQ5CH69_9ASTR
MLRKHCNQSDWSRNLCKGDVTFLLSGCVEACAFAEGKLLLGTKWILMIKEMPEGIVVYKKKQGGAQVHRQDDGIDYMRCFPLARIEADQLFLAFASYMGFMVYQMDVKSAFLYGEIDEEVYVTQPKGFEQRSFQPLKHVLQKETWCDEFEVLMKGEFEMSVMGELTFFLGLQVKQQPDGIFISQDKYVQDMLRKFDMESVRTSKHPYEAAKPKSKDEPDELLIVLVYGTQEILPLCWKLTMIVIMLVPMVIGNPQLVDLPNYWTTIDFKGSAKKSKLGTYWFLLAEQFLLVVFLVSAGSVVPAGLQPLAFVTPALTHIPIQATDDSMATLKYRDEHNRFGFLEKPKGSTDYHQGVGDHVEALLLIALICLCEGKKYNWSRYIFTGMVNNMNNSKKFLMFPSPMHWWPQCFLLLKLPLQLVHQGRQHKPTLRLPMNLLQTLWHFPLLSSLNMDSTSQDQHPPATPAARLNGAFPIHPLPTQVLIPTSTSAQVDQQGPSSDPHVESSSKENDSNPVPRSDAAPPEGITSGGAEDLLTLTTLYSLVSEQGKRIGCLESELQAHKLLFKDVMGKLVKRVKFLESKLKSRGRNVILSDSDNEEAEKQDVDSLIKLAKAAAFAADTSSVPTDATQENEFPPSSSIPTDLFVHGSAVPTGHASDFSVDPSNKGKSPMVEEDPPMKERSFRQIEEDRLGAEAARKLYEEEQAELAREQEEMKKKRQEDVINSAKYYNDDDWSDIMGQVHANKGLTADLLGPDVNEDNFATKMAAIIAERRRKFAAQRFQDKINKPMTYAQQRDYMRTFVKNQSSTIYTTGWTFKHVRSFSDDQLKDEFDKIRHALDNLQAQNLKRSLKRPGADVEQPGSKKSKSSAAPQTPVPAASHQSSAGVTPDVHQSPFVDTPPATPPHSPKASSHPDVTHDTSVDPPVAPTSSFATPVSRSSGPRTRSQSSDAGIKTYSTRRKSLATRKMPSSEVDLNAPDTSFIKVLSDDDSDDSADDSDPLFWHIFAAWEVIPTGLGDVNALYFTDKTSKYFTHLREILHLIDRQDLSKLYGMVVKHYEVHPLAGNGMILWGDLHVLFESTTGGSSVEVWNDQQEWVIHSWKLFPFSGVHVLETFTGKILYMFADTPYPLSASLMKKMLQHKLEVEIDGIGNDMTYAVQLIQFIKNQLASCVPSA